MDTSETYIKMCESAEEIQEQKENIAKGDYWCWSSYPGQTYWKTDNYPLPKIRSTKHHTAERIWLPRQDQLQEMVKRYSLAELCCDFEVFATSRYQDTENTTAFLFTSMEQLWLAFVMKEKHNKVWGGEGWNYCSIQLA